MITNKNSKTGIGYREWFREVNIILGEVIGLSALDMEDYTWRDDYESELTPIEAIEGALEYWGDDFMFSGIASESYDRLEEIRKQIEETAE